MDPRPTSSSSATEQDGFPEPQQQTALRRPIPIYFIAAWCFLGLNQYTNLLTCVLKRKFAGVEAAGQTWSLLGTLLFILVIWHTVRLVQLRPFNLWFSVAFFILWTLLIIVGMFLVTHKEESPFPTIVGCAVRGLFCLTSALYLLRRQFREFAVRFVAERERPKNLKMMQKVSQRRILQELKK